MMVAIEAEGRAVKREQDEMKKAQKDAKNKRPRGAR